MDKVSKKIIIIGLDGATWTLLKPWIEKGALPALGELMEKGVYGTLMSAVPCVTGAGTVTFYTGKNHCKWGGLDFPAFDPDTVTYKKIKEKNEAIWDILGRFGYKSAVLNVPTTYPPTETFGVMISGFSPPENDEYTYPKDFQEKVKGFHSKRETFLDSAPGNLFISTVKNKYRIIKDVLCDDNFDFSIFWIDEPDSMQHVFWSKKDDLLSLFQAIDNNLKNLLEQNPQADIIIISDHGFADRPIYEFYPKSWLKKEGYLRLKGGRVQQWLAQAINTFIIKVPFPYRYRCIEFLSFLQDKIRHPTKKKIKKESKKIALENRIESKVMGIDWSKTLATNHDFWGIKIMRENSNRDYEEVRNEIMGKMGELRDKNGEKIIKCVWKREEIFSGESIQKYPDIVYLPTGKFQPTGFLPFGIIKNRAIAPVIRSSAGAHMTIREGIFLAAGPRIKNVGNIGEINILDIAPTVLCAFNISIPADMDGRVLKEIFKPKNLNLG